MKLFLSLLMILSFALLTQGFAQASEVETFTTEISVNVDVDVGTSVPIVIYRNTHANNFLVINKPILEAREKQKVLTQKTALYKQVDELIIGNSYKNSLHLTEIAPNRHNVKSFGGAGLDYT